MGLHPSNELTVPRLFKAAENGEMVGSKTAGAVDSLALTLAGHLWWSVSAALRLRPDAPRTSDPARWAGLVNPKTAIEKFFQNGKSGLGRFASSVATTTRKAVFRVNRGTVGAKNVQN